MPKQHRWGQEGDDAAALAQAILAGSVTSELQSFKDFFDPEGPGGAIGLKYDYSTVKGQRNLRLNWLKLVKKINLWKQNKKDPNTDKRKSFPYIHTCLDSNTNDKFS